MEGGTLATISCSAAEERAVGEVLKVVRWRERGKGIKMVNENYSVEPLKESWAWRGARSGVALVRRARGKKRRRVRMIRGIRIENVIVLVNGFV